MRQDSRFRIWPARSLNAALSLARSKCSSEGWKSCAILRISSPAGRFVVFPSSGKTRFRWRDLRRHLNRRLRSCRSGTNCCFWRRILPSIPPTTVRLRSFSGCLAAIMPRLYMIRETACSTRWEKSRFRTPMRRFAPICAMSTSKTPYMKRVSRSV